MDRCRLGARKVHESARVLRGCLVDRSWHGHWVHMLVHLKAQAFLRRGYIAMGIKKATTLQFCCVSSLQLRISSCLLSPESSRSPWNSSRSWVLSWSVMVSAATNVEALSWGGQIWWWKPNGFGGAELNHTHTHTHFVSFYDDMET